MNTTHYIVVTSPWQPKRWAILNTITATVVEAGFSTREAAEEYLWREYSSAS